MRRLKLLSDYTSLDTPNVLTLIQDDQGDFHVSLYEGAKSQGERGIRIAASGTRYSPKVRQAFAALMLTLEEELSSPKCHPHLTELND